MVLRGPSFWLAPCAPWLGSAWWSLGRRLWNLGRSRFRICQWRPSRWFDGRAVQRPVSTCEVLVVGQVSNWAVLAIVACLARITGKPLLPEPEEYQELLLRLAQGGVVDGVRKVAEPTEDGFEFGRGPVILADLRRWLDS